MTNPSIQQSHVLSDPAQWVSLYGDYLYNFALGRLRNHTDAENVVQETFLAALNAKDKFAGKSSERTWLIGILKHKIVDHLRHLYKEKPVSDFVKDKQAIDQFFDQKNHLRQQPSGWIPKPDELLVNQEFWTVFYKCQNKLTKTAHDAFLLREMEKLDSKEVCKILNVTPSNLWVLLHRARLQLRECLEINWFETKKA